MNNLVSSKAEFQQKWRSDWKRRFSGGAETWLRMQAAYDLAQAGKRSGKIKARRVKNSLMPV